MIFPGWRIPPAKVPTKIRRVFSRAATLQADATRALLAEDPRVRAERLKPLFAEGLQWTETDSFTEDRYLWRLRAEMQIPPLFDPKAITFVGSVS